MTQAEFDRVYAWAVAFGPPVTVLRTYRQTRAKKEELVVGLELRLGRYHRFRAICSLWDFYQLLEELHVALTDPRIPLPPYMERYLDGLLAA